MSLQRSACITATLATTAEHRVQACCVCQLLETLCCCSAATTCSSCQPWLLHPSSVLQSSSGGEHISGGVHLPAFSNAAKQGICTSSTRALCRSIRHAQGSAWYAYCMQHELGWLHATHGPQAGRQASHHEMLPTPQWQHLSRLHAASCVCCALLAAVSRSKHMHSALIMTRDRRQRHLFRQSLLHAHAYSRHVLGWAKALSWQKLLCSIPCGRDSHRL